MDYRDFQNSQPVLVEIEQVVGLVSTDDLLCVGGRPGLFPQEAKPT
jgi:hypothetical protein